MVYVRFRFFSQGSNFRLLRQNGQHPQDVGEQEEVALRQRWIQPRPQLHQRPHHRDGIPGRKSGGRLPEQPRRGEEVLRRETRESLQDLQSLLGENLRQEKVSRTGRALPVR